MSWTAWIGVAVVRAYQASIGPLVGGTCRFEPSCSAYAIDAIREHGLLRGAMLASRRVARCHPFAPAGLDPVPPRADRT